MESINNIENKLLVPDTEEDMNDLAEASGDNVDKGELMMTFQLTTKTLLKKKQKFNKTIQLHLVILLL